MLAIPITIDALWLPLIALLSALFGFLFRSRQLHKLRRQVNSLEKEMLNNHAEILSLQQENGRLQEAGSQQKSRVVPMKEVKEANEENKEDKGNRKVIR